ncbi:MAG: adenylate kinase [Dehalococcoidia bacterium]|nr:adenylate kinase [Myxococcales bacterium]MCA9829693.1 adenylate kinase [Dehalococcoidia bacterium]MCB9485163.1 adenylate kinase [Thermoflexaceae bacterium]
MFIVLLGPPGAGKGTQAQRIADATRLLHVSTGDMFRENVKNETELGKTAKTFMDKGELVPDEVTIKMLLERIARPDAATGAMFDGFPRNVVQAAALDKAMASRNARIDHALLISVPDEELVARLGGRWICRNCGRLFHERNDPPKQDGVCDACGGELYQRDDDRPDVVMTRLEKQKPPAALIDHYRNAGVLTEINGEQPLDSVTSALLGALGMSQA